MTASLTYITSTTRLTGTTPLLISAVPHVNNDVMFVVCTTNEVYTNDSSINQAFDIVGINKWNLVYKTGRYFTNGASKSTTVWMCVSTSTASNDVTINFPTSAELYATVFAVSGINTQNVLIQASALGYNSGVGKVLVDYKWYPYKTTSNVVAFSYCKGSIPISFGPFASEVHQHIDASSTTYQFSLGLNTSPSSTSNPYVTTSDEGYGFALELRDASETKYPVILAHSLKESMVKPYPNHGLFVPKLYDSAKMNTMTASISSFTILDTLIIRSVNESTVQHDSAKMNTMTASISSFTILDTLIIRSVNESTVQHDSAKMNTMTGSITSFVIFDTLVTRSINESTVQHDSIKIDTQLAIISSFSLT